MRCKQNNKLEKNCIIIIIGVSGCGKTTVGKLLSESISIPFYDADDYHSKENIAKMSDGVPLNNDDRYPWLLLLAKKIEQWSKKSGAILACSALKESYREILSSKYKDIIWVFLCGTESLVAERVNQRRGHFMQSNLLSSQFEALEIPRDSIEIDISNPPPEIVREIKLKLKLHE